MTDFPALGQQAPNVWRDQLKAYIDERAIVDPETGEVIPAATEALHAWVDDALQDADLILGDDPRLGQAFDDPDYAYAIVDQEGRVALGIKPDGHVVARFALEPGSVDLNALGADVPVPSPITASGIRYAIVDSEDRKAFWIGDGGEVEIAKIGPSFLASIKQALTSSGITGATTVRSTYSVQEIKVVSGPDIALFGHSMLNGAASAVASVFGGSIHTVRNLSVGGEGSRTIVARQGGQPMTLAFSGNSIPASGRADVALVWAGAGAAAWPLLQMATSYTGYVVLADGTKVRGTFSMTRDPAATPYVHHAGDVYHFTRETPGDAISVKDALPFYFDVGEPRRGDIAVYWLGRNNYQTPDQVIADLQAAILYQSALDKRWLVLSEHHSDTADNAQKTAIAALNARYLALAGRRYIDTQRYLIERGLADAGITPTTQDTADIANGVVPTSLRADSLHLNAAGSAIVADLIKRRVLELGWF